MNAKLRHHARYYAGTNAGDNPTRYLDLLMRPGDPNHYGRDYLKPKTSGCALVVLALWRKIGVVHRLLTEAYKFGHATADMKRVAQDLGAYHSAGEVARGEYVPKAGDAVMIGPPEHAFTIMSITTHPRGWRLESVDGGQTWKDSRGRLQQGIRAKMRTWLLDGPAIDDQPDGEGPRAVGYVVDIDQLLLSATNTEPAPPSESAKTDPRILLGVDVSHYQEPEAIDWAVVARRYDFAIIKAVESTKRDAAVLQHVERARPHMTHLGLYLFPWQDTPAKAQVDAFRSAMDDAGIGAGDILPALDLEGKKGRTPDAYGDRIQEIIELLGDALIYIGPDFFDWMGRPAWLLEHPIWVAHYTDAPEPSWPWSDWAIWQHTGSGRIDGFAKDIDCNRARRLPIRGADGTGYF